MYIHVKFIVFRWGLNLGTLRDGYHIRSTSLVIFLIAILDVESQTTVGRHEESPIGQLPSDKFVE